MYEVTPHAGYHDLFRDGVFWAVLWEVRCDRSRRIILDVPTDHWVQKPESVMLERLWIGAVSYQYLEYNSFVYKYWDPWLEANPLHEDAGASIPVPLPELAVETNSVCSSLVITQLYK